MRKVGYLALPAASGDAAAVRERNALVRDAWARADAAQFTSETLAQAVATLGLAAGASRAVLRLDAALEPERSWVWRHDTLHEEHRFALVDERGQVVGDVQFAWGADDGFHEALLPRLETSVRKLAERWQPDAAHDEAS